MGYIRYHALIITDSGYPESKKLIKKVHRMSKDKAIDYMGTSKIVSPLVYSPINGHISFFIAPDGSKEGWESSELGDNMRDSIIDFIDSLKYEDGSSCIRYTEVFYGDEDGESKVERHN